MSLGTACSPAGDLENREGVGQETLALQDGDLGDKCQKKDDCLQDEMCASGQCACAPALVACGKKCVDLASNPANCGKCRVRCSKQACIAGVCGGPLPPKGDPSVGTPLEIDGVSQPGSTCNEFGEPDAEYSVNWPGGLYAVFQQPTATPKYPYNWGSAWNNWHSPYPSNGVLLSNGNDATTSDGWTTTSGYSGLEYVSRILQPYPYNVGTCVGVAATDPVSLESGLWTYELACATKLHSGVADGPAIHFDLGGSALYAVEHNTVTGSDLLDIFANCGAGQPGDPNGACVRSSSDLDMGYYTRGHATVAVNPCTHHAVVAFRWEENGASTSQSEILLNFFDSSGKSVGSPSTFVVNSNAYLSPVAACSGYSVDTEWVPRCKAGTSDCVDTAGSANSCVRQSGKPHVATKYRAATGHCYAYVAYDTDNCSQPTYMQAHLDVVDLGASTTTESPSLVQCYGGPNDTYGLTCGLSGCGYAQNEFGSIVTVNQLNSNENVGWFFYYQPSSGGTPDACNTSFVGFTDTAMGLTSMSFTGTIAGPFPTAFFNAADGPGDYVGVVKRGLPGDNLFVTWAQPFATQQSCVACQGTQYSLAVYGTKVCPGGGTCN